MEPVTPKKRRGRKSKKINTDSPNNQTTHNTTQQYSPPKNVTTEPDLLSKDIPTPTYTDIESSTPPDTQITEGQQQISATQTAIT